MQLSLNLYFYFLNKNGVSATQLQMLDVIFKRPQKNSYQTSKPRGRKSQILANKKFTTSTNQCAAFEANSQ